MPLQEDGLLSVQLTLPSVYTHSLAKPPLQISEQEPPVQLSKQSPWLSNPLCPVVEHVQLGTSPLSQLKQSRELVWQVN